MPVSLSEWRVRIGKFRCRGRKEYDYNYFWRKLDHLIKRNKRAESPKENNTPKCNTSSPNGSSNVAKSLGVNSPGKKDTSHSEALCAENSGSSTAEETKPVPDSTDVKNLATHPYEEDELDNRYIIIHQISISNKKSAGYPFNYTQGSKTDQSDVSIIEANNHSPAAVADGPVLSMESIRPDKEETSNSAPSGIGDQSSGLSPKPRQDTTRNAEQTTPIEKYLGSQTYPVLVSGPTSDETDDTKDIDCPDMTNTLLLRSGDVELNPGPNDTPTDESRDKDFDDFLRTVANQIHKDSDMDNLGVQLGFEPCDIARYIQKSRQDHTFMGTLDMLRDWRKRTKRSEEREQLMKALIASDHHRLAEFLKDGIAILDLKEAIKSGKAQWKRSRIMVIGPAGVGKTSLIRRLTGQEFNPKEKSTKGADQNVVTNDAVSSWKLENGAQTDDMIRSLATMDPEDQKHSPCSTGGEEYRSDTEITGGNRSTLGKESMSEATKENVLVTEDADRYIANISQSIPREEITRVKSSKLGITYSIWDFGGQEIYYITHPLFLSWRSLYILVIPLHLELTKRAPRGDDAENAQEQLKGSAVKTRTILELVHFWLMSVYTHAVPDSHHEPKVLLIGTFAGNVCSEIIEKKATDTFKKLKERLGSYPYWKQVLSPMCAIDNQFLQPSEVKKIQDRIDGLVKDSAYMKVLLPIKWTIFTTEIENSNQNTLTVDKAHSIMKRWGINDLKDVEAVLKFYHDIGHLIYHQGCELVVLKPQFLNSIVSNIITVIDDKKMEGELAEYWRDLKEKGILSIELIKAVWKEQEGHHDQLNNIIDMMMKFDLICEIPNRPDGKRGFFVPCRSSPELDEREIHKEDDKVEFTIDFHHFLPDGFLHRFYVRMAKWSMTKMEYIKRTFHCRQMVFDIDNGHRVVMTNDIQEGHEIKVKICAVVPFDAPPERKKAKVNLNKEIIDCLHDTLKDLKRLWARRIEYRVGIWCPRYAECECKGWIHIRDILKSKHGTACCDEGCRIYLGNIWRAFHTRGTQLPSEKQGGSSIGVHVDEANSSSVTGNTFIGQQNITKHYQYSHGSEDDSLGEPSTSTKRDKKTNPKTDSTTNEDEITRRDKRTMSDGSEDDSFDGRPRKRKKKTDRRTDSGDEDGRSRGDKRTL